MTPKYKIGDKFKVKNFLTVLFGNDITIIDIVNDPKYSKVSYKYEVHYSPQDSYIHYHRIEDFEKEVELGAFIRIKDTTNKDCSHTYIKYVGFINTYNYCTKCDKKED